MSERIDNKTSRLALAIAVLAVGRELGARITLQSDGFSIQVSAKGLHDLRTRPDALAAVKAVETVLFLADGNTKHDPDKVTDAMVRVLFRAAHALDRLVPAADAPVPPLPRQCNVMERDCG